MHIQPTEGAGSRTSRVRAANPRFLQFIRIHGIHHKGLGRKQLTGLEPLNLRCTAIVNRTLNSTRRTQNFSTAAAIISRLPKEDLLRALRTFQDLAPDARLKDNYVTYTKEKGFKDLRQVAVLALYMQHRCREILQVGLIQDLRTNRLLVSEDLWVYDGTFRLTQEGIEGEGRVYDAGGGIYRGSVTASSYNGEGHYELPNKLRLSGTFRRGQLHGTGQRDTYSAQGITTYKGSFHEGQYHGKGVINMSSGNSYEGDFEKGQFHGQGIFRTGLGTRYVGAFQRGLYHGAGELIVIGERKDVGEFKYGKLACHGQRFKGDGTIISGHFSNDKPVGSTSYTDKYGNKYVIQYAKGVAKRAAVVKMYSHKAYLLRVFNGKSKVREKISASTVTMSAHLADRVRHVIATQTPSTERKARFERCLVAFNEHCYNTLELEGSVEQIADARFRAPQKINAGFLKHSVVVIISDEQIFICNKGRAARKLEKSKRVHIKPIVHYVLTGSEAKKRDALAELFALLKQSKKVKGAIAKAYFYQSILDIDGIKQAKTSLLFSDNEKKAQQTGNCSLMSPKTAMYSILLLESAKELFCVNNGFNYPEINTNFEQLALFQEFLESEAFNAEFQTAAKEMADEEYHMLFGHSFKTAVLQDYIREQFEKSPYYQPELDKVLHMRLRVSHAASSVSDTGLLFHYSGDDTPIARCDASHYHYFKEGDTSTIVEYVSKRGNYYKGEVYKGIAHGKGTLTLACATVMEGDFEDGKPHGILKVTDIKGEVAFWEYNEGRKIKQIPFIKIDN